MIFGWWIYWLQVQVCDDQIDRLGFAGRGGFFFLFLVRCNGQLHCVASMRYAPQMLFSISLSFSMLLLFRLSVMSLNVWSDHLTVVRWTEVRVLEYTHRFVYCVYVLVYNSDVDKSLRGSYTRDGYKLNVRRTSTCSGRIKDLLFVFPHFLGDLFGTLMATWRWWWNEFIALKDLFENKY